MKVRIDISLLKQRQVFEVYLFQLIVFLIPNQLALHFWPTSSFVSGIRVDYLSPTLYLNDIFIFLFIIYSLFRYWNKWKTDFINKKYWILILVLIALVNIYSAINTFTAAYYWLRFVEFLLLAITVKRAKKIKPQHAYVPLFLSLFYSFILAMWQFVNKSTIGGVFYYFGERTFNVFTPGISLFYAFNHQWLRSYASFPHPNSLAAFTAVSFLFLQISKRRLIKYCTYIIATLLLIITYSLNAWLSLFMAIVFLFFRVKKFFYTPLLLFIISLTVSYMVTHYYTTFTLGQSEMERVYLLKHTTTLVNNNFFSGVGLGNFIYTLDKNAGPFAGGVLLQPVHNGYMLILSEFGILVSALVISLLVVYIKNIERMKYVSAILMFVFISMLFDHYWLTIHQNQLLLSILFGLWSKQIKV